jgi:hypothetical protein
MDEEEYFLLRCDRALSDININILEKPMSLILQGKENILLEDGASAFHGKARFLLDYMLSHPPEDSRRFSS